MISTHSAREDGDPNHCRWCVVPRKISTHSAREDGDGSVYYKRYILGISTHSAREDGDSRCIR